MRLDSLHPDEVRLLLAAQKSLVEQVSAGLAPHGPTKLAQTINRLLDVLGRYFEAHLVSIEQSPARELEAETATRVFAGYLSFIHNQYLAYLTQADPYSFPVELLHPLKDLLVRYGGYLKPLLDEVAQVGDGSVDIRLGTHFLVPKAPDVSHVKPEEMDAEYVRKFQAPVVKSFGESFILHPHHLVLGVAFEFLALPADLAAVVVSRSSFGRVGLVVATAIYVHPLWKGCLTLELANYGEIPLELPCGAPIAQLVFLRATTLGEAQKIGPARKSCPIRPEFARLKELKDWTELRRISKHLKAL